MIKRVGFALVFVVTSFVGATQLVAYRLGYSDELGRPLVFHDKVRVYWPWSVAVWYRRWGAGHPRVFEQALLVPLGELLFAAWVVGMMRRPRLKEIGKDCWGSLGDLKRAGLLTRAGVVVGKVGRRLLRFDLRQGHVLVVGGTRSGKTVGVIVPSLLSWPESVVVFDPKGELWRLTAGFRSTFSHCAFFNPSRSDSVKYNPMLEVRRGCEIRDAQNIAHVLADPSGEKNQFDIWDVSAAQLITALILHVLYTAQDDQKHLGTVRDLLLDFDTTCEQMMTTPHRLCPQTGEPQVHPEVMLVARSLTAAADRFRTSVVATAESYLTLFADPVVRDNIGRSDIALGDLMCSDAPMNLYIQAPPSDADRLKPLTRMMFNQVARTLMEHERRDTLGRPKRHDLLMVMEEFSSHGRLPFFERNLRQMGSYGLRAVLVVQSFNDLMQNYGGHQSLVDNCALTVAFASNDTATQSRVSQMTGTAVEFREGYSQSQNLTDRQRRTMNLNEHVRPLLQPGDVRQLPADEQLVFATGFKPFRTQKVRYFEERLFKQRLLKVPDQSQHVDVPRATVENPWLGERAKGPPLPLDTGSEETAPETADPELVLDGLDEDLEDGGLEDRYFV